MKICKDCGKTELEVEFTPSKTSYCRGCVKVRNTKYLRARGSKEKFIPVVTDTHKQCCDCKKLKPLEEFTNSPRGRKGKSAYCKPCMSLYIVNKIPVEIRRERTQIYRTTNREWWRSLHRINQFNRNNKVKLLSDGSITPKVVKELYNIECCRYCNHLIPVSERTLEHILPLNRGGLHTILNLTMACRTCNSSKGDMTEEEFINYKNQKRNE